MKSMSDTQTYSNRLAYHHNNKDLAEREENKKKSMNKQQQQQQNVKKSKNESSYSKRPASSDQTNEIRQFLGGLLIQLNNNNDKLRPLHSSTSTTPSISPASTCSKSSSKSLQNINFKVKNSQSGVKYQPDLLRHSMPSKMAVFTANLINQKSMLRQTNRMKASQSCNFKIFNQQNYESEDFKCEPRLVKSESSQFVPMRIAARNESEISDNETSDSNSFIMSRQGTIRGNVNHVKTSVKLILKDHQQVVTAPVLNTKLNNVNMSSKGNVSRNYEEEEKHKIVIYTTSLQVVRLSYDNCVRVKKILQNHRVRYEEKDLNKNKEHQRELKHRLGLTHVHIPHVFFNGKHIGNSDQLELYSDQGVLHKLFQDLKKIKVKIYCEKCGGYRFELCSLCNGSKKIFNNFTNLKCTKCNGDGLTRCDACLDQQE